MSFFVLIREKIQPYEFIGIIKIGIIKRIPTNLPRDSGSGWENGNKARGFHVEVTGFFRCTATTRGFRQAADVALVARRFPARKIRSASGLWLLASSRFWMICAMKA